jgi:hypothetical protein
MLSPHGGDATCKGSVGPQSVARSADKDDPHVGVSIRPLDPSTSADAPNTCPATHRREAVREQRLELSRPHEPVPVVSPAGEHTSEEPPAPLNHTDSIGARNVLAVSVSPRYRNLYVSTAVLSGNFRHPQRLRNLKTPATLTNSGANRRRVHGSVGIGGGGGGGVVGAQQDEK